MAEIQFSESYGCVRVCRTAKQKQKQNSQSNIQMYTHMSMGMTVCACACVCIVYTNTLVSSAHIIEISTWVLIGREWRQLTRDLHFNSYCMCMYVCMCALYTTHGVRTLLLTTVVKLANEKLDSHQPTAVTIQFDRLSYTFFAELSRSQFSCSANKPN